MKHLRAKMAALVIASTLDAITVVIALRMIQDAGIAGPAERNPLTLALFAVIGVNGFAILKIGIALLLYLRRDRLVIAWSGLRAVAFTRAASGLIYLAIIVGLIGFASNTWAIYQIASLR